MSNVDPNIAALAVVLKIAIAPLISSHPDRAQVVNRLEQVIDQCNRQKGVQMAAVFAQHILDQVRLEDAAASR